MNKIPSAARIARPLSFLIAACGAFVSARAQIVAEPIAQIAAVNLERYVVSATRTAQDPRYTPSSVTALSLTDLSAAQTPSLLLALAQQPGVTVSRTGPAGGLTTLFLRGAAAHHTLFIVDGVRMNDRSAAYYNFLGGADLGGLDRIEVLRGPQSTLYGSSAMGGVILLSTTHGGGETSGRVAAGGGSFDTFEAAAAVQGGAGRLGYSASVSRFDTANELPRNGFDQWSYATRLEFEVTPALRVGATFRGQNGEFEQVGSRFFVSPGIAANDNYLTTIYGEARAGETFTSRLTAAVHRRVYDWTDLSGSPWAVDSALRNTRKILDWQNTWTPVNEIELVAGANYERSRYDVDGVPSRDEVRAGYVSGTARPSDSVTLTAGVRRDDFDSVGGATTWRTGVSWLPIPTTKLRATYGTGFSAPGSDDRYGVPSWGQRANPDIKPERSRGWDVGVDHTLPQGNVTLSATYFENRFTDLFEWQTVDFTTFEGQIVNVARAKTNGVEVAASGEIATRVTVEATYTYQDAEDAATGQRLIRRPRHSGNVEVRVKIAKAWLAGAGVRFAADRMESAGPYESFTTARVFASYWVRPDLKLNLRVENALDESYEDVLGYAALPRGVFGGIEWSF